MRRVYDSLVSLDIVGSLQNNVLLIPILLIVLLVIVFLIKDIILNEEKTINKIKDILNKHYLIILILLILSYIINILI